MERWRVTILVVVFSATLSTACSQEPVEMLRVRVDTDVRSQTLDEGHRLIGVTASPDLNITGAGIEPSLRLHGPQVGKGFWAGAGRGSAVVIEAGIAGQNVFTFMAGLALSPVGAIVGGLDGAISESARTVSRPLTSGRDTEAKIGRELKRRKIEVALRDHITQTGRGSTSQRFIALPHETFSVEVLSYGGNSHAREMLIESGIDAILDVHITRFGLSGMSADDPLIALELNVRSLWYAQDMPLQFNEWEYKGKERRLSTWTSDGNRLLREELEHAVQRLAKRVVNGIAKKY